MEEIDVKQFVARHEALGSFRMLDASLSEKIAHEVERWGCERIRVSQVGPHPVWSVTARMGRCIYDCEQIIKVAVKRMAQTLGFKVKLRDIVASIYRGRVKAMFCLDEPLLNPP